MQQEKLKEWYIQDPNEINKLWGFIKKNGYFEEFTKAVSWLRENNLLKGSVLDVAAGVCWTSALLSKEKEIEHIDAVDFSYHRIHDLAPNVITGMAGDDSKITRILGSFYEIKSDNMYDIIFMSQAFHHADKPFELLRECDSKLKQGGVIVLTGEHNIRIIQYLKNVIKSAIKNKKLSFNFHKLFPSDPVLGDHYYRWSDYQLFFSSFDYAVKLIDRSHTLVIAGIKV